MHAQSVAAYLPEQTVNYPRANVSQNPELFRIERARTISYQAAWAAINSRRVIGSTRPRQDHKSQRSIRDILAGRRANQPGLGKSPCRVPVAKIFCFARRANHSYNSRRPVPKEGHCATPSTREGMRWTRAAFETKALLADDEVVWS